MPFRQTILPAAFGLAMLALTPLNVAPLHARQDSEEAQQAPQEEEDVITIYGEGPPRDAAMAAFQRGDFETAEIEFGANLECAQRVETMEDFAYDQARGAELLSDAGTTGAAQSVGQPGVSTQSPSGAGYNNTARPDEGDVAARSCDMPAYQIYMMALSQIMQGKYDEAKRNLYRVIRMSRDERFFDAHYRLALLEILDDNLDEAQERLDHLLVLQRRCQRRGERCEWRGELDEAVAYLEVAIANAREPSAG